MQIAQFRKRRNAAKVTAKQLEQMLISKEYRCNCTGIEMTPALSSLDHIDPKAMGGDDDVENLQIVLPCINKAKGTMSQAQFVAMCHAVARHCADTGDETWVSYVGHSASR